MTPADDYPGEMQILRQVDDAAAERLLAGHADSDELESVATVMRALREVATQPVEPNATLRRQMAAGVFTGAPVYAYGTAGGGLVRRIAAAVVARAGRLRLATRLAAVAVAAAVLGTATVGFAGSLPEPVQDRFETVVESVTPYEFREKAPGGVGPATDPGTNHPDNGNRGNGNAGNGNADKDHPGNRGRGADEDRGRPTDLPTPAQQAPGQQHRPTAPPGHGD